MIEKALTMALIAVAVCIAASSIGHAIQSWSIKAHCALAHDAICIHGETSRIAHETRPL
jgi:hypothetical protein